jgi:hypothetical protein
MTSALTASAQMGGRSSRSCRSTLRRTSRTGISVHRDEIIIISSHPPDHLSKQWLERDWWPQTGGRSELRWAVSTHVGSDAVNADGEGFNVIPDDDPELTAMSAERGDGFVIKATPEPDIAPDDVITEPERADEPVSGDER